jgi:hypothetical protein
MTDSTLQTLEDQLSRIEGLEPTALAAAWESLFGQPPPKGLSRRLLEHAAAYQLQAKIYGGLKPNIRRKLLQMGGKASTTKDGKARRAQQAPLSPGSRLVREWGGRVHTVDVADNGFLYAGQRYRSLSEIARAITGARWSGPRFFGL